MRDQTWRDIVETDELTRTGVQYLGYAHTAFNGVTDLFLTALPATMLWSLNMKTRLKIGLAFLLGLSLLYALWFIYLLILFVA